MTSSSVQLRIQHLIITPTAWSWKEATFLSRGRVYAKKNYQKNGKSEDGKNWKLHQAIF